MTELDRAIAALRDGRMIVIAGDHFRRGDMDLAMAAGHVTPDAVNFMANHGRGLICLAITPVRAMRLGISLVNSGQARQSGRPFGRSIEAKAGVTTGISAADRAHTIAVAVARDTTGDDLVCPGHVFPLIAAAGGVAERAAAAEAAIELCRLADAGDAAVICSIMRDDGEMARPDDIKELVTRFDLPVATVDELLAHLATGPE